MEEIASVLDAGDGEYVNHGSLSACLKQAAKRERDWQALRERLTAATKPAIWVNELLADMDRLDAEPHP